MARTGALVLLLAAAAVAVASDGIAPFMTYEFLRNRFSKLDEQLCRAWSVDDANPLITSIRESRKPFAKCSIVGNGAIILNSSCGAQIDNADLVIRFNSPAIRGFESDVGKRTDQLWINGDIAEAERGRGHLTDPIAYHYAQNDGLMIVSREDVAKVKSRYEQQFTTFRKRYIQALQCHPREELPVPFATLVKFISAQWYVALRAVVQAAEEHAGRRCRQLDKQDVVLTTGFMAVVTAAAWCDETVVYGFGNSFCPHWRHYWHKARSGGVLAHHWDSEAYIYGLLVGDDRSEVQRLLLGRNSGDDELLGRVRFVLGSCEAPSKRGVSPYVRAQTECDHRKRLPHLAAWSKVCHIGKSDFSDAGGDGVDAVYLDDAFFETPPGSGSRNSFRRSLQRAGIDVENSADGELRNGQYLVDAYFADNKEQQAWFSRAEHRHLQRLLFEDYDVNADKLVTPSEYYAVFDRRRMDARHTRELYSLIVAFANGDTGDTRKRRQKVEGAPLRADDLLHFFHCRYYDPHEVDIALFARLFSADGKHFSEDDFVLIDVVLQLIHRRLLFATLLGKPEPGLNETLAGVLPLY